MIQVFKLQFLLLIVVHMLQDGALSFTPTMTKHAAISLLQKSRTKLLEAQSDSSPNSSDLSSTATATPTSTLSVPLSWEEMVRQAVSAMKEAASQGQNRQIVRILLPRDSASGDFGIYMESNAGEDNNVDNNSNSVALVPPDESWQGGIMQLYRAAAPTARKILQAFTKNKQGGVPPRILEDRSVDESGVDGVSFFESDDGQVSCWLQPLQDSVDDILKNANNQKNGVDDTITILVNPQWRLVDDALDSASRQDGFLGGLASFLGGKGGALKRLQEAGFVPVYTLEGYVCRGANVRLMQVLDSKWTVFCERDDRESFVRVGTTPSNVRPTYQEVDQMLNDSDIGFKYARDIGMSPKL